MQYQKIFGKHKNWWFKSEAIGELLIQEVFEDGIKIENIKIIELTNLFNGKKKLSITLKNDKTIVAKINCLENEYKLGSNVPFKK